jgi:hypothetical protein
VTAKEGHKQRKQPSQLRRRIPTSDEVTQRYCIYLHNASSAKPSICVVQPDFILAYCGHKTTHISLERSYHSPAIQRPSAASQKSQLNFFRRTPNGNTPQSLIRRIETMSTLETSQASSSQSCQVTDPKVRSSPVLCSLRSFHPSLHLPLFQLACSRWICTYDFRFSNRDILSWITLHYLVS